MTPLQQYEETLFNARVRKTNAIERLDKCHLMMAEAAKNLLEMEQITCSHETVTESAEAVYYNHGRSREEYPVSKCVRCGKEIL